MHFGENQLSRGLIGLSPYPQLIPIFNHWVRASSTTSYRRFNLAMGRSLPLRVQTQRLKRPIQTRFRYGLNTGLTLPPSTELAGSFFRHAITHPRGGSTDCKRPVSGTISLPPRGIFSPFTHGTSAIGHQVFRLTGWSRQIHTGFHGPCPTLGPHHENNLRLPDSPVYGQTIPGCSATFRAFYHSPETTAIVS